MRTQFALLIVFAFATGCSTIDNVVGAGTPNPVTGESIPPPMRVYGGVQIAAGDGKRDLAAAKSAKESASSVAHFSADVILSAVGDTLTLPFTIHAAYQRAADER